MPSATRNHGPGVLPFEWPVWLTALVVAAMFVAGRLADGLSTGPAVAINAASVVIGVVALHEVWAKYRARF